MNTISTPADIRRALADLSSDLLSLSTPEVRELLSRIDEEGFAAAGRNPVAFLAATPDEALTASPEIAAEAARLLAAQTARRQNADWWSREHPGEQLLVAYICLEFGLHESLPIYSGGLGVLAGDHLKSAAELGIPLVAFGFLYRNGYFRQALDARRGQRESYPEFDPASLPVTSVRSPDGGQLTVEVDLAGETVTAALWRADVGGVSLYLLDSDVGSNSKRAREVTRVLYPSDPELRIRQEVLLGVGAVHALDALGLEATVFHMNEGHTAFLAYERIRRLVESGSTWQEALDQVRASTLFTTHTPVPAGNETHDPAIVKRIVGRLADRRALALGRDGNRGKTFGMTELALRTAAHANAVSAAHGGVARAMWTDMWPNHRPAAGAPADHVTNAVHARTWISGELTALLREAGVQLEAPPAEQAWENADSLDPTSLWAAHLRRKSALIDYANRRLANGAVGAPKAELVPEALTIGFARRFASYKRAGLLASDGAKLLRLLGDPDRPVQIIFAGKAHPNDREGKAILKRILGIARDAGFGGRIAVLDDYSIEQGRLLVQGADLWLNTPRRLCEASGTSGMKAGMNGVLNLSVLDGWWPEAYDPAIGWAVAEAISKRGDAAEAAEILRLLEKEVVPAFYDRDAVGLPARWVETMKASIRAIGENFNGGRMLAEYARLYALANESAQTTAPRA